MPSIQEIEHWYSEALSISRENRVQYLNSKLSTQPDLLNEVLTLVTSSEDEQSLLTQLRNQLTENHSSELESTPSIDRYDAIEEIGRGGMAVVYRAVRKDGVFDHEVAVKVLKRGMDTDEIVRRFRQERNLLGRLKHPNIAQIYDGGVTSDGRPYFVMELIEGEELTSYVEKNGLSEKDRLNLFISVCKAVEFAHQNLIIHRDIKPSNILVNKNGEVKLMDFGIAKLLSPDDDQTLTIPESRVLTPKFASPEQINNDVVDIRSDVYQLGKVLELLLSDPISKDLESIILFALREVRGDRYANISQLEGDIKNYISGYPVAAVRPHKLYAFKKFVIRNKAAVVSSLTVVLILILSTVVSLRQLSISEKERAKALLISNFLTGMFESIDPSYSKGDTITVQHIVHENLKRLDELKSQPDLLGELYFILSEISRKIGDNESRIHSLNQILSLADSKSDIYFNALIEASKANSFAPVADSLVNVAINTAIRSGEKSQYFDALINMASNEFRTNQNFNRADSIFQIADSIRNESPNANLDLINFYTELGLFQWYRNELDSATQLLSKVIELRAKRDPDDLEIANVKNNLAGILYSNDRVDESREIYEDILETEIKVYGRHSIVLLTTLSNLLKCYNYQKDVSSGQSLIHHVDSIMSKQDSIPFYKRAALSIEKARFYSINREKDLAIRLANESIELYSSLGEEHYMVAQTRGDLGDLYMENGMFNLARKEYQFAFDIINRQFGSVYSSQYEQKLNMLDSAMVNSTN